MTEHVPTTGSWSMARRGLLIASSASLATLTAAGRGPASAASSKGTPGTWTGSASANGWPVLTAAPITRVEGSDLRLAVAAGPVSAVLVHCLRRFVYEIDDQLRPEDVVGWTPRASVDADFESNHFSGTALAIRPRAYPIGAPDGLATRDATVVRDILAECEGVVGWGADAVPQKQSHFQIVVEPGDRALSDVAAKLAGWSTRPDRGPGTSVDPFSARRRRVAIDVERAQGVLDR